MELVQELLVTAFIAVLFSFLVARLISAAVAGDADREVEMKSMKIVDQEIVMEETKFEQKFRAKVPEKSEEELSGEEKKVTSVEKEVEFDIENKEIDAIGEESTTDNVVSVAVAGDADLEVEMKSMKIVDEEIVPDDMKFEREFKAKVPEKLEELSVKEMVMSVEKKAEFNTENKKIKVLESEATVRDEEKIDDWEGIERSDLEKVFAEAAEFVRVGNDDDRLGSDVQMEFYGLYKVATEGPCREPQPIALMVSSRARWNAWQKLGNMSPDEAMEQYVSLLSDKVPRWMEDNPAGNTGAYFSEAGRSGTPDPNSISFTNERKEELEPGAEEGDLTGGSNLANRPKNDKHCLAA